MKQVVLFIRDPDADDMATVYPDEASARRELVQYVRERACLTAAQDAPSTATDEAVEVENYFNDPRRIYAIAKIEPDPGMRR